jgi:hypothetical protein
LSTCSVENCDLKVFESLDCSLHCQKNDYQVDNSLLSDFFLSFKNYILDEFFEHNDILSNKYNKQDISTYFSQNKFDNEEINEVLKKQIITPASIIFPTRDSRDTFDYKKFLNLFGQIHFNYCEFYLSSLDLQDIEVFFQDCLFHVRWDLQNYKVLENADNVIYQTCTFKDDISNYTTDEHKKYYPLKSNQFDYTCTFEKKLSLNYVQFDGLLFSTEQGNHLEEKLKIKVIDLENCIFNRKLVINRFQIESFTAKNTIFENKFEFKENDVTNFNINSSNFKKLMDCYGSEFEEFRVFKSVFDDFVGFENYKFGKEKDIQEQYTANFTYAIFLNFINFRNTTFYSALELENINLKESPNFLKSSIELTYTNIETIRIIKHPFEKIGNIIEGNKYFSKEMQKYKEELEAQSWNGNIQEKLVFNINDYISNFGQNYIKLILLIIIISILHFLIVLEHESNLLYEIYELANDCIRSLADFINNIAKNILPFKSLLKNGMEFISLVFGVTYSILIWQIIVVVKMHTRRG